MIIKGLDRPFGYYHNGKTMSINRQEAKTIKDAAYFMNIGFDGFETLNLILGKSLYDVINNKIFYTLLNIKSHGFKIDIIEDEDYTVDIENILNDEEQRETFLLPLLEKIQSRIYKSKSKEQLHNYIDDLVTVIKNFKKVEEKCEIIKERKNNKITSSLSHYNEDDIYYLLNHNIRLVYVNANEEEFLVEYDKIPDTIVDINNKFGLTNLKFYDYDDPFKLLLSTNGEFLDWCDYDVRKDIIDRLIKLQKGEEEVSDYKIIINDNLNKVRDMIYHDILEM